MKNAWVGIVLILWVGGRAWGDPVIDDGPSDRTCGFPGEVKTVQERVQDCADRYYPGYTTRKSDISSAKLALVAETQSGKQVWKVVDPGKPVDGLLIGDVSETEMYWNRANVVCKMVTDSEGFIPNVEWRLMTGDEQAQIGTKDQRSYRERSKVLGIVDKKIEGNGLWAKVPNIERTRVWSSSCCGSDCAWKLSGPVGNVVPDHKRGLNAVLCVGRVKSGH